MIIDAEGLRADTTKLDWRSRCDNSSGNCVEVAFDGDQVRVRDS